MAQSGFTPILLYASNTASSTPSAGNLTNSANGAELAVNTADKRLFTKNSGGSVVELGTNPSALTVAGTTTLSALTASTALALNASKEVVSVTNTGTGNNVLSASPTLTGTIGAAALTLSSDLTLSGGTANGVLYLNGSKVATSGSALTFDGTKLGVNIASPTLNFEVGGNTATGYMHSGVSVFSIGSKNNYPVSFDVNNTEQMRLTSTGLGIGTTPSYKLDVQTSAGRFQVQNFGAGSVLLYSNGALAYNAATTGHQWQLNGSEQMRLDSSGNLGIGTSSPGAKLETVASGTALYFSGGDSSVARRLQFNATTTTNTGDTQNINALGSTGVLAFSINSTERMRLDSSGNLGLGVTPSATSGSYKNFQTGGAVLMGISGGADLYLNGNATFNSGWRYIYNGFATRYSQNDVAGGAHAWFTAASGTAGNVISFTQAMTLDASGRLGVGVTDPDAPVTIQANSGANAIRIRGRATGNLSYLVFRNNANSADLGVIGSGDTGITFDYGGSERARITSGGDLFVGSQTGGSYRGWFENTGASNGVAWRDTAASGSAAVGFDSRFTQAAGTGFVHFQGVAASSTAVFQVLGNGNVVNTNNSYGAISDVKLKQDIADASSQWADIKALRVRKYRLKSDPVGPLQIGLVAQEAEVVSPGLVEERADRDEEGNDLGTVTKLVKYSVLYMKAVKALQEAMTRIEQLEARVAALEAQP